MIEYRPWSIRELEQSLASYKKGELSILDMQLGGGCNYNCVYCDSPNREIPLLNRVSILEEFEKETKFDWVFICGLGEPLFGNNKAELKQIIHYSNERNIGVSIFSNISLLDDDIINLVRDDKLNIIFKFDSLSLDIISYLYGTSRPDIHLSSVEELVQNVVCKEKTTNLAASIVVTNENADEIGDLLDYCDDHNVYPLIAGLENCGKGIDCYKQLSPSEEMLSNIRELLDKRYHGEYSIPICPSVISGIQVSANGDVILDQITGLSCHWFWLEEPNIHSCANVLITSSYKDIRNKIFAYRNQQYDFAKSLSQQHFALPIGGCGGDIVELLALYIDAHQSILSTYQQL